MPTRACSKPAIAGRTPSSSTCVCQWSTASAFSARFAPSKGHSVQPISRRHRDRRLFSRRTGPASSFRPGAHVAFKPLWFDDLLSLAHTYKGDILTRDEFRFIRACRRRQPVDPLPCGSCGRPAGGEYRALRERHSPADLCRIPDLATEVTMQPVRRIELDAAILFPICCCRSSRWASGSTSSGRKAAG